MRSCRLDSEPQGFFGGSRFSKSSHSERRLAILKGAGFSLGNVLCWRLAVPRIAFVLCLNVLWMAFELQVREI